MPERKSIEQFKGVKRIQSGINGLDGMIQGGFVQDSTVTIKGGTGTGKTIACLQYLYSGAVTYKEAGMFLSFAEPKEAIYQHGRTFGWDFEELEKKNMFTYLKYEPHEVAKIMEEGGGSIRDLMESINAKRLAIDSLTAYSLLFESRYKENESIINLFEMLRKWDCTTLVTSESEVNVNGESGERLGFLTDGIINMYYLRKGTRRVRALEVIKMRDTRHMDKLSKFEITSKGLNVYPGVDPLGKKRE